MNEKSLKVLEQYEIEVISTRRGRGSYICETDQGRKLFTNCSSSEKKMQFVNRVLERMKAQGYFFADIALKNKEGNLITPDRDEPPCILKDWYEGRECDTKSMTDIEQAIQGLAHLHKWMYLAPEGEQKEFGCAGGNLLEELERHNRELRKVYSFIRRRKKKNSFEILFLNSFSMFAEQAEEALECLQNSSYPELQQEMLEKGSICHGNFNQHNVWFPARGQIFIGNFDRCCYDIQVSDLYQFMRKIMEKQEWSFGTGYRILESYDHEKTIDKAEREYLRIRLLYPEKFWKLANQYYNHNKCWIPEKSTEKLQKLIDQEKLRNSFLKTLE